MSISYVNLKVLKYGCLIFNWLIRANPEYRTVSYDEIKQKVITQANDYRRVKAYTP